MERKLKQNYKIFTEDDPLEQEYKMSEEYTEMLTSHMIYNLHPTNDHMIDVIEETFDYLSVMLQKAIVEHKFKYKDLMGILPLKINKANHIAKLKKNEGYTYDEAKELVKDLYINPLKSKTE